MSNITEGTVIHGTGRTQDLLRAFADELERVKPENDTNLLLQARCDADILDGTPTPEEQEEAVDTLCVIMDELDIIAAQHGFYFGAHEGDGSDYGYWEVVEI